MEGQISKPQENKATGDLRLQAAKAHRSPLNLQCVTRGQGQKEA